MSSSLRNISVFVTAGHQSSDIHQPIRGRIIVGYGVTISFYLVIGMGVALALWVGEDSTRNRHQLFPILTAPFFWPVYIPMLLVNRSAATLAKTTLQQHRSEDDMGLLITQVELELEIAFDSLRGWAVNVFTGERDRIAELRTAWRQQADHIRELDQLLIVASKETRIYDSTPSDSPEVSRPDHAKVPIAAALPTGTSAMADEQRFERLEAEIENQTRFAACERTRRENILKLKTVRTQMHDNLLATLAWVRELVTMIHLAKYTGAPASRAEELVQQIAAAVEGLSNVVHHAA